MPQLKPAGTSEPQLVEQTDGQVSTEQGSNDNLISSQTMQNTDEKHQQQANQLPQTGNGEDKKASLLGFAFAALTSLIGVAGIKRKKEDK